MTALLDPAVLFFIVGLFAGLVRSNLEIPPAISRFLALYLLMALGLKGGLSLAETGLTYEVGMSLLLAIVLASVVPIIGFFVLRPLTTPFNAIAVAATYGSVSAVTFITANQFLDLNGVAHGGHMAAAMALMESPAIIVAIVLANILRRQHAAGAQGVRVTAQGSLVVTDEGHGASIKAILHESLTNGTHLLLLASLAIGFISGDAGKAVMKPFSADLFKGMLAFFLLDMGLSVAKSLPDIKGKAPVLVLYAAISPFVHAALALVLAVGLALPLGDTALLMVLSASASYIVVPAVLRYAIPEANPAVYLALPIGITFPINLLIGIPLYTSVARLFI
ncbi:MAG: sodium-dependent bicarbonate transport family permease [Burkholderiaceae bacterium]